MATSIMMHGTMDTAVSTGVDPQLSPRFRYTNRGFLSRLLVGAQLKSSLAKNKVHYIEHRAWCKHVLVSLLMLIAIALTPKLLPDRLGFEWATPRELCQGRGEKTLAVEGHLLDLANVTDGERFVADLQFELSCVNSSAARFYYGDLTTPKRMLWPNECTRQKVASSLTKKVCEPEVRAQKTECLELNGVQKAATFLTGVKRCKTVWVDPVCSTVVDEGAQSELLALQDEQKAAKNKSALAQNATLATITSLSQNNQRMKDIVSEGMMRVDIASNMYIGYAILTMLFGRPLIVFKRGKRTRITGVTLGLSKASFTLAVVVIITVYDSVSSLLKETDLKALLKNFHADPCYADPEFSRSRSDLIVTTCERVSELHLETSRKVKVLNDMRHKIKMFGLCEKNGTRSPHPALTFVDERITLYRSGQSTNPAVCNVTTLNHETESPDPRRKTSAVKSILGSGVLAQLLAKIVLTNLAIQVISYLEPLAAHGGKVELWGDGEVSAEEEEAISRFARDKHLVSLLVNIALLVIEIVLIAYATIRTITASEARSSPEVVKHTSGVIEKIAHRVCDNVLQRLTS